MILIQLEEIFRAAYAVRNAYVSTIKFLSSVVNSKLNRICHIKYIIILNVDSQTITQGTEGLELDAEDLALICCVILGESLKSLFWGFYSYKVRLIIQ